MSQIINRKFFRWVLTLVIVDVLVAAVNGPIASARFVTDPADFQCWGPNGVNGTGQAVLLGGVANSGVMNFDLYPTLPDGPGELFYQYAACTRWLGSIGSPNLSRVEGWVWDSNLGWVSFYCDDELAFPPAGPPYTNAGIDCGNQKYGVTIDVDDGEFHGFAWGDGIGWISFNCEDDASGCSALNTHKVRAEVDPDCLGEVYSSNGVTGIFHSPPLALPGTCPAHSENDSFAWSDNVGWIDFAGIRLFIPSFLSVNVALEVSPDPTPLTKVDAPAANGIDDYDIKVSITDKDGNPIVAGVQYDIYIAPIWVKDTVKFVQTDPAAIDDHKSDNLGAVNKPIANGDFIYDGFGSYVDTVRSFAPTSNMNVYQESGVVDVPNETFVLPKAKALPLQLNDLELEGVDVWIYDKINGNCVLPAGFGGPCVGPVRYNTANPSESILKFAPVGDISVLTDEGGHPYIEATSGIPEAFSVKTVERAAGATSNLQYSLFLGLDTPGTSYDVVVFDTNGDGEFDTVNDLPTLSPAPKGTYPLPGIFKKPEDSPESALVPNPYLWSKVSYTAGLRNVEYYSAKMPRVTGTVVINPVAVVRGSVYSTGVSNPRTGITIRSLGDVSTNILRDTIFRNVSSLVAGVTLNDGSGVLISDGAGQAFSIVGASGVSFLKDSTQKPRVYYFRKGDVTFYDSTLAALGEDLTWGGDRTLIVMGGNVFIDQNLYNTPDPLVAKPKLGIIVLKDLSDPNKAKQGHVYIHPDVTNIQANIYADGSVFSYDGDHNHINAIGEPVFANVSDYQEQTKNQLYIEGSLASQNTIGGSALNQPIIGTGELSTGTPSQLGDTPKGPARALLYDLNFLRSFGAGFMRDPNGNAMPGNGDGDIDEITKSDGSPWTICDTTYALGPGDLLPSSLTDSDAHGAQGLNNTVDPATMTCAGSTDFGAVYITFDPPPQSLPGFNVVTGAEVKIRPQ